MEKIEESLSRRIKKLEEELKTPDSRIAFLTAFLEEIDFASLRSYAYPRGSPVGGAETTREVLYASKIS